ncbi:MAG: 16S rRNA (cytidine(1402)-2'-O)-methyltransferase [Candidatus Nanopelagicales bacterium]|nr:16S rRNA (cytidine(1402)-2'-O)-methyltransferase [Actinomycetota bacterium]MDA9869836.1 16S rRNA (cytidine(1402)-2'-O)-methyltransferase [bacterium]MDC1474628.1 16S rRNA (cytidine(1402)-2'-O)-methyltransferase [Candidatus Nanopelagicales bacterium]MBT5183056.1 16S rRNA (cytidine(1402)-2'-O)-methyltransferase [Actinomycetota bacterium]MDA9017322.1 16S rRNA (cytidine(1402)-2'-O)-methyltransferase [Actinomycetota bacterium]
MGPKESGRIGGQLIFAATPMGNVKDASARLVAAIQQADVIAAEDTRKFMNLSSRLGVRFNAQLVSHFEANEAGRVGQLLDSVAAGNLVLVVSDAGMPQVSDPGYRLAVAAIESGIDYQVLPGPSAVLTALLLSGLPADRFCFEGFLPRKSGDRVRALTQLAHEPRTMIFFEAPHRLAKTLNDMAEVFGPDRIAAVAREMTKTYEEVIRGSLQELNVWAAGEIKGEITLVLAGSNSTAASEMSLAELVTLVQEEVAAGASMKDAAAAVSREFGRSKRDVYEAVIAAKAAASAGD